MAKKLDRIINGIRYRSTRRIDIGGPERGGVSDVSLWICRRVAVLERYSIWDDGTGACTGTTYIVLDTARDGISDDTLYGDEARNVLQSIADHLCYPSLPEEQQSEEWDAVVALARRHAPSEAAA